MGNEQVIPSHVNNHQLLKPTTITLKLNRQSRGCHRYNHRKSNSIKAINHDTDHKSFQQNLTKTLESNEFDTFLDDVVNEVQQEYDPDTKSTTKALSKPKLVKKQPKNNSNNNKLSFVPKENIIKNINTQFEYVQQLGKGASCRVYKAKHIEKNKLYAIKQLAKKHKINKQLFRKEVELLKKLHHPNILCYYDCYIDDKYYYIATEHCSGGTMLEKIIKMKSFSERKASQYIRTILLAVNYMHSLNIVHRDLKAQNMVFNKHGADAVLQIIDFGDSKAVKNDAKYNEFVGTVHYVPPEITRTRTGLELKKSDLWSIGVIAYLLVCGRPPFVGFSHQEILSNIVNKNNKITYPNGIHITRSCKSFIESLLCHNIKKRLNANEALQHEWICGDTSSTICIADDVLKCLSKYSYNNKLQSILVNAILSELETKDKKILSEGIITMNRQLSNMNTNSVVNYLLLHSNICNNNIFSNDDDDIDWDCLEGLDVDNILNEVELKEKELEEIEIDNDTRNYKINIENENNNLENIFDNEEFNDEYDIDEFDDEYDDLKYLNLTNNYGHGSNRSIVSASFSVSSIDLSSQSISTSKFRAIMDKSNKKYDVEQVINDISDGNGQIPLHRISTYSKRIDTKVNLFVDVESDNEYE